MASIQDLMQALAQMEGFNKQGTISQRNNNPGNLRYDKGQIGQETTVNGKYATFASVQDGWNALENYINGKADKGMTLRSFISMYAPPSENNTSNYLTFLVNKLGIGADDPISGLKKKIIVKKK